MPEPTNNYSNATIEDIGALYFYLKRHFDDILDLCNVKQAGTLLKKYERLQNLYYRNLFLGFSPSAEIDQFRKDIKQATADVKHSTESLKNAVGVLKAIEGGVKLAKSIIDLGAL